VRSLDDEAGVTKGKKTNKFTVWLNIGSDHIYLGSYFDELKGGNGIRHVSVVRPRARQ
jgi:hypothetical protein